LITLVKRIQKTLEPGSWLGKRLMSGVSSGFDPRSPKLAGADLVP
jgi:hypothetical protein